VDGLWVSLLILWVVVEGVQFYRGIPFPRRMIAPLVCVVVASGLIGLGQADRQDDTGYQAMPFSLEKAFVK